MQLQEVSVRIRRMIDQKLLPYEDSSTEEAILDTASTRFSDEYLFEKIKGAARYMAMRVRSEYLDEYVQTASSLDGIQMMRFLPDTVQVGPERAARKTHIALRKTSRTYSNKEPVFVYEDGEFYTVPSGGTFNFVKTPYVFDQFPEVLVDSIIYRVLTVCYARLGMTEVSQMFAKKTQESMSQYVQPMFKRA